MASTLKDSVVHWRKKLDRTTDEETVLNVIHKLAKVPITVELLQDTGIGKVIRSLAKQSGKIGLKASAVLHNWRDVVAAAQKTSERPQKTDRKENTKTSQKREDTNTENTTVLKHHKHSISVHEKRRKNKHLINFEHTNSDEDHLTKTAKKLDSKYLLNGSSIDALSLGKNVAHDNGKECPSLCAQIPFTEGFKLAGNESPRFQLSKKLKYGDNRPSVLEIGNSDTTKLRISQITDSSSNQSEKKLTKEAAHKLPSKQKDKSKHNLYVSKHINVENAICDLTVSNNEQLICQTGLKGDSSKKIAVAILPVDSPKKREKEKKHKSSDRKSHKHSSRDKNKHSRQKSHSKNSDKSKKELKKPFSIEDTEAFTSSEVRFEDCLGFNDIVTLKKKKSSKSSLKKVKPDGNKERDSVKMNKATEDSTKVIDDLKKTKHLSEKTVQCETLDFKKTKHFSEKNVHFEVPNLKDLQQSSERIVHFEPPDMRITSFNEVDISSTLPQTQPNYRPLPQRNYDCFPIKKKVLSNEDAIKFTSSRKEKTAIYSGRKALVFTSVPSLFDSCIRILIENIDAIDYLGNLPYFLLKPVMERCTAIQLDNLEHYNPYLLEDTHELWEIHCKRDFRNHTPDENETWRDLYWRASEEREAKLKRLTNNIAASMTKTGPGRQVKLAYVDTVVKPPRDIARKQAKHGTALPVNHTVKTGPPSKATPRPTAPVTNARLAAVAAIPIIPKKPKVAPLMAKTLKSMKSCFRR